VLQSIFNYLSQFLFKLNPRFFFWLKDTWLSSNAEHYYKAIRLIKVLQLNTDGKMIVDIGAANGDSAAYFAKAFPHSKVRGYEPISHMYRLAAATHRRPNLVFINKGLSDTAGSATIHISANNFSSSTLQFNQAAIAREASVQQDRMAIAKTETISLARLDDELPDENVLLIKIDIQGAEVLALSGANNLLTRTDVVLIEMNNHDLYHDGCQYFDADAFLRKNNFILADMVITFRDARKMMKEYDALYVRKNLIF
jgi:FkbM family methyltransferase